ncbi:hypothetical protein [Clostridium sp. ZS2-4]|uniref:hypothetical protein n=1 Tax=Clostridium sp. ZS2-4 TaxID=2987703 RepID=UPI00227B082B|nr:hypothetical protein [Clostridium sp. ZS2-4]MCY6355919.1 hypothetical protein [Clostridium sp. ZS2-4]
MTLSSFDSRKFMLAQIVIKSLNILKSQGTLDLEEIFNEKFENLVELNFLKKGISLILDGYSTEHIQFSLELEKIKYIKSPSVCEEALQLISICEKLIPCIQNSNLLRTDSIFSYIFSKQQYEQLQEALKKIDVKYNLTKKDIMQNIYSVLNTYYFYPNTIEDKMEDFKIKLGIAEYAFIKNYVYDRYTFDYIAQSDTEEVLVDIINPGDYIDIDKLRNKINYIKQEIFLNEDKLSLVIGILHKAIDNNRNIFENSAHIPSSLVNDVILSKTVSSIEKLLSIVKSCSTINKEDVDSQLIMIINKEGISFLQGPPKILES